MEGLKAKQGEKGGKEEGRKKEELKTCKDDVVGIP